MLVGGADTRIDSRADQAERLLNGVGLEQWQSQALEIWIA